MSETQGAPAPIAPPPLPTLVTPAAPVAAPGAPPLPATSTEPDPKWIAERLERHEKQVFAKLGFKDEADAKAAAEARKATEEAAKTTEQKRVEAERRAKELEGQVTERDELITKLAASRMASLTDAQRAAVESVAGEDALLQLSLIDSFAATWGAAATATQTTTTTTPRPAQTAAPAAPAPAPGTPKTDFEKWNDLKTTDPVAASLFYQLNSMRVEQSRTRT